MTTPRRILSATALAVLVAVATLGATFTALCGNGTSCAYNGTEVRPGWQTFDRIRTNFNDHETRISAALVGLSSSVEKEIALFDGTTGKLVERATGTGFVRVTSGVYQTPTAQITAAELPTGIGQVLRTSVTLTDAQIKALPTTPITLVAAPGAGRQVNLVMAIVFTKFSAGAYTNVNTTSAAWVIDRSSGNDLSLYLRNKSADSVTNLTSLLGAASRYAQFEVFKLYATASGIHAQTFDTEANTGLRLKAYNSVDGDYTGGNSANTATVVVFYTDEAVP